MNISNTNSGCNGLPNNYIYYCNHYLSTLPNQTISVSLTSGQVYSQGFAIFIDWNQNSLFDLPAERVLTTNSVPAGLTTTGSFVIPSNQANGKYRMRVKSVFATQGFSIQPCTFYNSGETEDYSIYINTVIDPPSVSASISANSTTLCTLQNLSLTITHNSSVTPTFSWTGPNGFTSNNQNIVLNNLSTQQSGNYILTINTGSTVCPSVYSQNISVITGPTLNITSSSTNLCSGSQATITALGAQGYTWSNGSNQNSIIVSPTVNTTYTVNASNSFSCTLTSTFNQNVVICTSNEEIANTSGYNLFPNPTNHNLNFNISKPVTVTFFNQLGQAIDSYFIETSTNISCENYTNGVYFVRLKNSEFELNTKVIIQK